MKKILFWILVLSIASFIGYLKVNNKNLHMFWLDIFGSEIEFIDYTKDLAIDKDTGIITNGTPFKSFDKLEKKWITWDDKTKEKSLINIHLTGTKFEDYPEWLKNDPITISIEAKLK